MADILLREQDLANQVIAEAKLQFDGDYDVLFSTVASIPITSNNSAQRGTGSYTFLEAMVNSGARSLDIVAAVESIEDLNIYYYSPDYSISYPLESHLLAICSYEVDDQQLKQIIAFDNEGNQLMLDAQQPPTVPVFVLGVNERNGLLEQREGTAVYNQANKALDDGQTVHNELLTGLMFSKPNLDAWPFGQPEIYLLFGLRNGGIKQYYPEVDKKGQWFSYPQGLMIYSYANVPDNMFYKIEMWDEDPGTARSYPIKGAFVWADKTYSIDATVTTYKDDDFIGETLVYFWHGKPAIYNMGSAAAVKLTY